MTPKGTVQYVISGQLVLYVGLALCILLVPRFLTEYDEGGISNYGTMLKTVIPYTLALGGGGLCTLRAGSLIRLKSGDQEVRLVRHTLYAVGTLLLLVLLTSYVYALNTVLADIHIGVAVVLLLVELAAGIWMTVKLLRDTFAWSLCILQVAGALLVFDSAIGPFRVLLLAQLLGSLTFGALLIRSVLFLNRRLSRGSERGIMEH